MRRYGIDFPSFGVFWKDGATEEMPGESTNAGAAAIFSVDDIKLEEDDLDLEEKVEDNEGEGEPEIEVEGKESKVSKESNKVAELEATIRELQKDVLKMSSQKREIPLETKKGKDTEELTDAQLVAILKEHKDDPAVLLNVARHIAEQTAKSTRDATLADVTKQNRFSQLSGMANRVLGEDEDGYLAANPKVKSGLDEYAANLDLSDHPLGKLAAYAILRLVEKGKGDPGKVDKETKPESKESNDKGKKMDKTRLSNLSTKTTLTPDQKAMAKKFGVKEETYAKFVGGKS